MKYHSTLLFYIFACLGIIISQEIILTLLKRRCIIWVRNRINSFIKAKGFLKHDIQANPFNGNLLVLLIPIMQILAGLGRGESTGKTVGHIKIWMLLMKNIHVIIFTIYNMENVQKSAAIQISKKKQSLKKQKIRGDLFNDWF